LNHRVSLVAFIPNAHTKSDTSSSSARWWQGLKQRWVGLSKLGHLSSWLSKVGTDEFGQNHS
jgi:hypothetical protein